MQAIQLGNNQEQFLKFVFNKTDNCLLPFLVDSLGIINWLENGRRGEGEGSRLLQGYLCDTEGSTFCGRSEAFVSEAEMISLAQLCVMEEFRW